jgi:aryl-alcohol dehydrogenase-like predicted oxidoreductase
VRPLGATGLAVAPVALGTVKLGRDRAVKYPRPFVLPSDAEVDRLLGRAAELGVNLLDTAPAYGVAEERLGRALAGGQRRHFLLSTKAGETFDGTRSHFDFSPAAIRTSVLGSLRRLRTERLDLVLLHSDGRDEGPARFGPAVEALAELRRADAVRAIGFSGKTVAGGLYAVAACDVVMVALAPGDVAQLPVIAAARAAGKGVLIKKALASGHLLTGAAPDEALARAMRLALIEAGADTVVVGTSDPGHLEEAVAAARAVLGRAGPRAGWIGLSSPP